MYQQILQREKMKIRIVVVTDLHRILELEKRNWLPRKRAHKKEFEKRIRTFPKGFLVITYTDDMIIGMSTAFLFPKQYTVDRLNVIPSKTTLHVPKGKVYYIHSITIDKDYRGRELGTALMQANEENAKRFNAEKIYLISARPEKPFYTKQGYIQVSNYSVYKNTKMAIFEKILS